MGSPISVVVANLVMEDVEKRAIDSFGQPPRIWKRFVDDTFVILDKVAVDKFFTHLDQIQTSIKFTMEGEEDNCISFFDILLHGTIQKHSIQIFTVSPHIQRTLSKFQIRTPFRTQICCCQCVDPQSQFTN